MIGENRLKNIEELSKQMRRILLEVSFKCGQSAHIGGALSIIEVLAVLYEEILDIDLKNPKDRFILSKGHGFLGLLSALYCKGYIKKEEFLTFQSNGSEFIAHPIINSKYGIESSNGSLGQGLSFGVGLALSYKKKKKDKNIYVLVGDGECYEGAIWEAAITATESCLNNLFVIVDCNGFQNDGAIKDSMIFEKMKSKWAGFGWNTIPCDGHKINDLSEAFKKKSINKPTVIIAKTVKGKGISFMEKNNDWHHGRLTETLYNKAIEEL